MKIFVRQEKKVDPRSRKFVDMVAKILETHGITNEVERKKCAFYLFKSTIRFYKKAQNVFEKGADVVDENTAQGQAEEMAGIFSKYGITSEDEQEAVLVEYFSTLTELGMLGVG